MDTNTTRKTYENVFDGDGRTIFDGVVDSCQAISEIYQQTVTIDLNVEQRIE